MRKLFKHIGMICLALAVAVGSFFIPMRKPNQSQMASANDSTLKFYSFNGSNIFIPLYYNGTGRYFLDFDVRFAYDFTNNYLLINFDESLFKRLDGNSVSTYPFDLSSSTAVVTETPIFYEDFTSQSYTRNTSFYASTSVWFDFTISINNVSIDNSISIFNGLINKIQLSSSPITVDGNNIQSNTVSYYDNNGSSLSFTFESGLGFDGFTDRTYYLNESLTNEETYNLGYNNGLADNQTHIYNNGYLAGFDDGFYDGKNAGISVANNYSFLSLFGALFDAPVSMLMGLLNFEFLGINLWAFVTSLFTLALVLFIIKLIMGR